MHNKEHNSRMKDEKLSKLKTKCKKYKGTICKYNAILINA